MRESVHITDVCHSYGRVPSLRNIRLTFEPGTVTALVGNNGSGKSTLLNILAGTLRATSGSVSGIPANTALVPQRSAVPDLLPVSVRRTVEMGRWRARGLFGRLTCRDNEVVQAAMADMGIEELADRNLSDLSGGQRQRTFIAQGLAQCAPMLLLDEPLSALDGRTVAQIDEAIRRESLAGTTVVLATHHRHQADSADRIVHLDEGRIV